MVEQPGAWGRDALRASGLDPEIGGRLADAVADLPVRVQVLRRPGGAPTGARDGAEPAASRGRHTVMLVHSGQPPWARRLDDVGPDELGSLDPGLCLETRPPDIGAPVDGPLLLVCTHGRRDRCCATLGRPIADTLGALYPETVWETSHIGGHRFAGNLVVLPEGLVYGSLDVAAAVDTVAGHLAGRVSLGHVRGRSALPRLAQAAEVLVRAHLDATGLDAVRVRSFQPDADGGSATVVLATDASVLTARVVREPTGRPRPLSCDSDGELEDPGVVRLVELTTRSTSEAP